MRGLVFVVLEEIFVELRRDTRWMWFLIELLLNRVFFISIGFDGFLVWKKFLLNSIYIEDNRVKVEKKYNFDW